MYINYCDNSNYLENVCLIITYGTNKKKCEMLSMKILKRKLNNVKNYSNGGIDNMSDFKYKVGDKVQIKSLDFYNENKNILGNVECGDALMTIEKARFCGKIVTISSISDVTDTYGIEEDNGLWKWTDEMIERLVERNGKTYPYKIGDRVTLKGSNRCATITDLKYNCQGNLSYYIKIDNDKDISIDYPTDLLLPYDNMIEGLVEEKCDYVQTDNLSGYIQVTPSGACSYGFSESYGFSDSEGNETSEWHLPEGYQFVDENGNVINATKIALEKKKREYPKTYGECCSVLKQPWDKIFVLECAIMEGNVTGLTESEIDLFKVFIKLKRCRDAYWKLYGEEMGLDKPWEPDFDGTFEDGTPIKYVIYNNGTRIVKERKSSPNHILAFPTEEMRDAFYENFKKDIEFCKELL